MKRQHQRTPEKKLLNQLWKVLLLKENHSEALKLWNTHPLMTPKLKEKVILDMASFNHEAKPRALDFILKMDPSLIHAHIPEPFHESGNVLHAAILNGWQMDVEKPAFELFLHYGVDLEFRKQGATEWREDSQFPGNWGDGRTPLLDCAWTARYQWIPMLLEAGANPEAVDDAGLNFLDIFRAWSGKMIQMPDDAKQTLTYWLTQDVGQKQMLLQYQNPAHFQVFLNHYPEIIQGWLAEHERQQLQNIPEANHLIQKKSGHL